MRLTRLVLGPAVIAMVLGAAPAFASASATPGGSAQGLSHRPVCGPPAAGTARCHAELLANGSGAPLASVSYASGYRPADLGSAYKYSLPAAGSAWVWNGRTVAIVDAYDNPSVEADLAAYRSQFGLPPCTTANGCFAKINQRGGTPYPAANVGWGQEIALDVDMASAVCVDCKVLLVEADSTSYANLGAAVDMAAARGATAISNSYGGGEFNGETSYESHYNHPGTAITVSSGDGGYGVEFPASSRYVTAVGGTSLSRNTATARGWSETAWSGAGSGCSAYVAKPAWQTDTGCARRTVADVAAVANPNTGVAVYDSYGSSGGANWMVFGGTSVASPIVASVYALAGNASSTAGGSYAYSHRTSLFDVTSGSNGSCRSRAPYLCTAVTGYDGPTGLGTPNGVGAF
ncbi:MAG: peptidase S8 [Acidimicrobiales bacterium]